MDIDLHTYFLPFVHDGFENRSVVGTRAAGCHHNFARVSDALRRHFADSGTSSVGSEPHQGPFFEYRGKVPGYHRQGCGRNDTGTVEDPGVDVLRQLQVILGRAAGRKDGRIAGFEHRLRLIFVELINVLVRVDEARHGGHAPAIDDLQAGGVGRTGGSGYDLAVTDDDRAGLDDRTSDRNHTDISDRHILRQKFRAESRHTQAGNQCQARNADRCFIIFKKHMSVA